MGTFKQRYGDRALIVGATSGIGRALARQLAADGMDIVAVARTQSKLDAEAEALRSEFGVEVLTIAADLSQPSGVRAVIDGVGDLEIGVLIPCAALETSGYLVQGDPAAELRMLQMNCGAPMQLSRHFGARMADRRRGAILLVSSLSGWAGQPYMAHYGACKAYVLSLGEALHQEMKDFGVDVSVLSPGPTQTPMMVGTGIDFEAMGMAIMSPEDVAAAGLAALGSRPNAVPGLRNKLMTTMMTRLLPRRAATAMFKQMMGKALGIHTALPAPAA